MFYWHFALNRWLGLRLELVGALIVFFTALTNVITSTSGINNTGMMTSSSSLIIRHMIMTYHHQESSWKFPYSIDTSSCYWSFTYCLRLALVGLSISYTLSLTSTLNWSVRQWTELEVCMNAVARVVHYTELQPEAPLVRDDVSPPFDWPSSCNIQFEDFSLRYKEGMDNVLKGISCEINDKEKLGT